MQMEVLREKERRKYSQRRWFLEGRKEEEEISVKENSSLGRKLSKMGGRREASYLFASISLLFQTSFWRMLE